MTSLVASREGKAGTVALGGSRARVRSPLHKPKRPSLTSHIHPAGQPPHVATHLGYAPFAPDAGPVDFFGAASEAEGSHRGLIVGLLGGKQPVPLPPGCPLRAGNASCRTWR